MHRVDLNQQECLGYEWTYQVEKRYTHWRALSNSFIGKPTEENTWKLKAKN